MEYATCKNIISKFEPSLLVSDKNAREMLGVVKFLPKNWYQNNMELIHSRLSKQLIKRNATGTNE
jgi:hypothetical protein